MCDLSHLRRLRASLQVVIFLSRLRCLRRRCAFLDCDAEIPSPFFHKTLSASEDAMAFGRCRGTDLLDIYILFCLQTQKSH